MTTEKTFTTSTALPLRHRLSRISLRLLLVLIALLAVWLAWLTNRARRQEEVVRELQAKGYTFAFDYEYPPGVSIVSRAKDPNARPSAPAWLRHWVGEEYFRRLVVVWWRRDWPNRWARKIDARSDDPREDDQFLRKLTARGGLRVLMLQNLDISSAALVECAPNLGEIERLEIEFCPNVDDKVFSLIERLPKLRYLTIDTCPITDRQLQAVGSRPELRTLRLSSETLEGEGLRQLSASRSLEELSLVSRLIDDKALAGLDLRGLKQLSILSDRVTVAGLRSISRMSGLAQLRLECHASDESIEALRPLQNLTWLIITPTGGSLSDRTLAAIKAFPKLEYLTLGNRRSDWTHFSDEALLDLVRSLPALRVMEIEQQYLGRDAMIDLKLARPGLQIKPTQ